MPSHEQFEIISGGKKDHKHGDKQHRIQQHGGFGLFVDFGHTGEKGDTFRVGRSFLFLIVNMCTGRLPVSYTHLTLPTRRTV